MKSIPEEYRESLQKIISIARLEMSKGKELSAIVFFGSFDSNKEGYKNGLLPIPTDLISDDNDCATYVLRKLAKIEKPDFIITATEAYALETIKTKNLSKEEIKRIKQIEVKNHPDRKEVFMILLETPICLWRGMSEIKILDKDKRTFDDFEFEQGGKTEGRFIFFTSDDETKH